MMGSKLYILEDTDCFKLVDGDGNVQHIEAKLSADASGHEHKGPGEGGGQFVSKDSLSDYESPQLKQNREIVKKLNNPTARKLTPKQAKEKETRELHDKLNKMPDEDVKRLATKHGIDASKYEMRHNLNREILSNVAAKAELLTVKVT